LLRAEEAFFIWKSSLTDATEDYEEFTVRDRRRAQERQSQLRTKPRRGLQPYLKGNGSGDCPNSTENSQCMPELGYFPDQWKKSSVISIRKPGTDASSPKGYRPISLLSILRKKFETLLKNRLRLHMEDSNA